MRKPDNFLRIGYLIGAAFELLAVVPMLSPTLFGKAMGMADFQPGSDYRYAMDVASVFTLAWIAAMLWAARRPVERRAIGLLSMAVFVGNALCGYYAAASGFVEIQMIVPSWIVQVVIIGLLGFSYVTARRRAGLDPAVA